MKNTEDDELIFIYWEDYKPPDKNHGNKKNYIHKC